MHLRAALLMFVLSLPILSAGHAVRADEAKDDAISRLVHSHDPEISIAIGRVYLKQVAVRAARDVLAQRGRAARLGAAWNATAPEWREAEVQLLGAARPILDAQLENPAWFYEAWSREAARLLDAEEADELAHHFETEGGREQRIVIELLMVGETVMANYTMTGKMLYTMADTRAEIEHLQSVWWKHDPMTARDFSRYPETLRFVTRDPGIKYAKMLALQGVARVIEHFDRVAAEVSTAVRAAAPAADAAVARFAAR